VTEHDRRDRAAGGRIDLVLEAFQDHAHQRADAEVGGPGVRTGVAELGELVLHT
jgi:hypothetical protein